MATLLTITVVLPLLGGVGLLLAPGLDYRRARWVAMGVALATLAATVVLVVAFRPGAVAPQFAVKPGGHYGLPWLDMPHGPGIRFALGLDGISLWLFALTSLLQITAISSSWESVRERAPAHYALLLALESGLLGLFASLDVVLFYVFFEFTLIPLFFLYTLAGSLLTLLGVIALVVVHHRYSSPRVLTFSIPELTLGLATIDWANRWPDWLQAHSWTSPQVLIFLLLFAGFAIKVPLFPFHTWLPLAHVEAPTAGSVILAGVLLKVGGYGFLRFNLGMTPLGAQALFPLLATIAVIGVLYGALTALAQTDMKRLVAYSSVSHMGFVALGLFALNGTGIDGAVLQMLNHGLTTGALFACVGVIYERYHTREMAELGGLWDRLPLWAFFFILAALGSAALPGLNGFVGEFPILLGMFARAPAAAVLAAIGVILGAYYLLWMLQRVVFGPLKEPIGHDETSSGHESGHGPAPVRPLGWHEIAGLTPIMVLIVVIGVYPRPFFDRIRPSVEPIAVHLENSSRSATRGVAQGILPGPIPGPTTTANLAQDRAR